MISKTVVLDPVEPAPLSLRHALGVTLDLQLRLLTQDNTPVDPDTLLAQLMLLPRSQGGVGAYDVTTASKAGGDGMVSIPGAALTDNVGYTIELYQRRQADNPSDPPIPVRLLAKGAMMLQGEAYQSLGPFSMINVPTVVGPQGPQGIPGTTGVPGATGPMGPEGPANVLTIGSVTTGPPGSMAQVSITGVSPNQVINFVIPEGLGGATGPTGSQGIQGVKGDTGATGPTGATGSQGIQGIPGPTGSTGPQGPIGNTGTTGSQGPQGIQGATGPTGPQGATGANITLGTALPGSAVDGALFWNTTTNVLYVREAGAWVQVDAVWAT